MAHNKLCKKFNTCLILLNILDLARSLLLLDAKDKYSGV